MKDFIDFEMGFFRQDQFSYHVELRYDDPTDVTQSLLEIGRFTVRCPGVNSLPWTPEVRAGADCPGIPG